MKLSTVALITLVMITVGYVMRVGLAFGPLLSNPVSFVASSVNTWALMFFFLIVFFGIGLLFGNLNALAMEPLGHIAGVGAAVVGALTTTISLLLGILIGQSYNGTVLPLIGGFAALTLASVLVMRWAENKKAVPQYG